MKKTVTVTQRLKMFPWFLALVLSSVFLTHCSSEPTGPVFVQEPLPYAETALEPYMSSKTLAYHFGKHHAAYVKNANAMMKELSVKGKTPEEVIIKASKKEKYHGLFNQAAQAWNHSFFWNCLTPGGGGAPTGDLLHKIDQAFGSVDQFKSDFIAKGKGVFGSGWVWLVADEDGDLSIMTTADADTPVAHDLTPLFGVDVWEHSYYLDYQNKRTDYLAAILEHLVNWDFVASCLGGEHHE